MGSCKGGALEVQEITGPGNLINSSIAGCHSQSCMDLGHDKLQHVGCQMQNVWGAHKPHFV